VLAHLHGLPTPPDAFGLVHTDVQVGNLRIDDARLTLFDFDDCDYEWFASDIAISLFYALQDPLTSGDPTAFARRFLGCFLDGYAREHRLERTWLRELPWFLKQRELALYIALWQAFGAGPMPPWPDRFMSGRLARIRSDGPVVDLDFAAL
jgi:Ser/Thr protein kinase RdoA (MazF antagonist)